MNNFGQFGALVSRAQKAGVFELFSRRFKRLRRQGLAPHEAGERAIREALDEGSPARPAKILFLRHAKR